MERILTVMMIGLLCLSMFSTFAPSQIKVGASSPPGMIRDVTGYPSVNYELLLWGNPEINGFPDTSVTAFRIYKDGGLLATVDWHTCRYRDYNPVNRWCQYGVSAVNAAGEGPQKTFSDWWGSNPMVYYDLTVYCNPPEGGYIYGMASQNLRNGQTTAGKMYIPALVTTTPAPGYTFTGQWASSGSISIDYYYPQPICYITNWWGNDAAITAYFQKLYLVTFTESGLPQGVKWSLSFDGQSPQSSTSNVIQIWALNGDHSFSISTLPGYTASPASGLIHIAGADVQQAITFSLNPSGMTTAWNEFSDSYSEPNPFVTWAGMTGCYGMASTASMYFMRKTLGDTSYPTLPSQLPDVAYSTSDLNLQEKYDYTRLRWYIDTLNNASLAVMFNQLYFSTCTVQWGALPQWENQQFIYLLGNLTLGRPVVLNLGFDWPDANPPGANHGWYHAVVAFGEEPEMMNGNPTGIVDISIYDPNYPKATQVATYDTTTGSFLYHVVVWPYPPNPQYIDYNLFYVVNPPDMLPHVPVTPANYQADRFDWTRHWLANCVTGYTIFIADKMISVTASSSGLKDYFTTWGDSQTFVCNIPGSSGIQEGNVQVIAIPSDVSYSVADPSMSKSAVMISQVSNESGQLVGYEYFVNATTTQDSLNYTITPSSDGLSISAGTDALNATITFFSATLQTYSVAQTTNKLINAMQTVNFTQPPASYVMTTISSKSVVGQGYSLDVNVTVANQGSSTEAFNFTVFANDTIIGTLANVNPLGNSNTTMTITWNTTSFARGKYSISAYARPVQDQINIININFTGSWVIVTVVGDVNCDKIVNVFDILELKYHRSGPPPGPGGYDPNVDVNGDGVIDVFDILIAKAHLGQSW